MEELFVKALYESYGDEENPQVSHKHSEDEKLKPLVEEEKKEWTVVKDSFIKIACMIVVIL